MSGDDLNLNRLKVKKFEFYAACAEEMIAYVDEEFIFDNDDVDPIERNESHSPIISTKKQRNYCVVCKLEETWRKVANKKDSTGKHSRRQCHMSVCLSSNCKLHAHSAVMDHDRKILEIDCFQGMTCFEILHSEECRGLWIPKQSEDVDATRNLPDDGGAIFTRRVRGCSYSVTRTHPIYKHLKKKYDVPAETRKRRRSSDEDGDGRGDIFESDTQDIIAEDESV